MRSVLISDTEYKDGSGEGLWGEIIKLLKEINIETSIVVVRIGTDKASVMMGTDKGIFRRLKALNPHLINIPLPCT